MYSQYGQDSYIKNKFFQNKTDGYFVNIGANDGVSLDNTLLFEKEGWTGVCIEPNPEIFKKLIDNRKCICHNVALSDSDGVVNFLKIEGYSEMLSGILEFYDPRHLQRVDYELKMYGGSKTIIEIEAKKFSSLNIKKEIDYVSIDVEGAELKILENIDFSTYDIHVLSVENNFSESTIINFMNKNGYDIDCVLHADNIFVKRGKI